MYEIGFLVGAVNNSYSVKYYYSDNTDETINKSGQSNSNLNTMYDDFYKSFTDYNADENNTDKFITKFEVTLSDISVLDTLYWQYDDSTATGSFATTTTTTTTTLPPAPNGISSYTITESSSGITVDWDTPSDNGTAIGGYRILVAETYDQDYNANTWFEVYRSTDTDTTEFTLPWVDNNDAIEYDTLNGTYYYRLSTCASNWMCNDVEATYTVDNTLGPPMNPTVENVYNSGVLVEWDEPNTGTRTATTYELYYRIDAQNETVVYNLTETSYTIPYSAITNDTYEFSIRAYSSTYNVYSGYSTEPTLEVFNQKAQDDADAAAEAARIAEEERIAAEKAEQERREREAREEAERIAREKAIEEEKDSNFAETGYYELDSERADREQREYEEEQERLRLEEEARQKALQEEREANFAETGYMELDFEREQREYEEEQARIEEEIKNTVVIVTDGEELSEEEQEEIEELVDAIIEIQETVDFEEFEIEEEIIEIDIILEDVVIVFEPIEEDELEQDETDTSDSGFPIPEEKSEEELEDLSKDELEEYKEERKEVVEAFVEELEEEIIEEVLPETVTVEEFKEIKEKDVEELTEEEVAIVVEVATEVIEEVVDTEELTEVIEAEDIVILEEEELEDLSEEELEAYEEELEEVIEEFVEELETEELVVVVEQIAEVGVENLAVADEQTIKVVQAVVAEVVDTETVEELSEEEVEAVAEVLGFEEEEDVQIIAEVAEKEEAVAEAVSEYVERAVENADVENYTLADTVTEVQVELFLENPVGQLLDVNIEELDISSLGDDMTSDQREKAQEVVVPVIIASQIIAQAGAVLRRF